MELKEVLGWRRSIRFYLPYRPVERAKVEKMLEAARRASCVGNVSNTRAIVVWRDQASPELMKALTPPLGYQQMQTAPCFIVWYSDAAAYEIDHWIDSLKELADMRRLGTDAEETKQLIEKFLRPVFTPMWKQAAVAPLAFMDSGQAVAQATLVAYDEGGGLTAFLKVYTTPGDPSEGVLQCFRQLKAAASQLTAIDELAHATTIATNTLLEKKGARTCLLTTRGFEDILELRRHNRPQMYNLFQKISAPLVPRRLRIGITERLDED